MFLPVSTNNEDICVIMLCINHSLKMKTYSLLAS